MIPIRIIQVTLMSLSYFCLRAINGSIPIVILAMIDKNNPNRYDWTTTHISMISNVTLFSMYLFMIPCNYLPKILRENKITFITLFGMGASYAIIPLIASLGWWSVCLLRAFGGIMFGAIAPIAYTMLAKWAPVHERTRMSLLLTCGATLGNVFGSSITGIIIQRLGWQYVFIIIGSMTCLWAFIPAIMMVDSPEKHPNLSIKERALYKSSDDKKDTELQFVSPPWLQIITSPAVWSINLASLALEATSVVLFVQFPLFLKDVMKFDIEKTGLIMTLQIFTLWISSFPFCYLSDYAIKYGAPISSVRKCCTTLVIWGSTIVLLILCYVERPTYIVVLLIISALCCAGATAGYTTNNMDISPNFAGAIHSFSSTITCPNLIITPLIWAQIVTDTTSASQWHSCFIYTAVFLFLTNIFCIIFTEGEPQKWDSQRASLNKKNIEETIIPE